MKRYAQIISMLALLACVTSRAQAASIFTFTFTGEGVTAAGTLNASPNGDGTFTATDGAGTVMGAVVDGTMTLIPNPNPPGPATKSIFVEQIVLSFNYDDQLLPGQDPLITHNGLLFSLPGGALLNIYGFFDPGGNYSLFEYSSAGSSSVQGGGFFSLTSLTPVPEPPSLVHMVSVGLAVAGIAWWRRKARPIAA